MEKEKKENDNIIENDCEYREVRKCDISMPYWLPRKPIINSEADYNLKDSVKERGLLNPLTVREIGNGKYELLAGSRRFASIDSIDSLDTVWIHVRKNKTSNYEAKKDCSDENRHRKDVDDDVRDKYYYDMYQDGLSEGKITSISDMSKDVSIDTGTLRKYINAGEERTKNIDDQIIQHASTTSLTTTRKLESEVPNIRRKILEMEKQSTIAPKNISDITKRITACIHEGIPEKIISKMIDMNISSIGVDINSPIDNNSVSVNTVGNVNINENGNENVKNTKVSFDIDNFDTMTSVMTVSYPDVRQYIISKKIDLKDAVNINRFENVDARRQLVNEKIKIENWKKKSLETFDKEWDVNIDIRKQQVQDIANNGETDLKTKFDIDLQQKLNVMKDADRLHDEEFFRKYRSLQDRLNRTILAFHPKKLKTEKGKDTISEMIKSMYEILRLVMIETGQIKTNSKNDAENNSGHHFVDVEAKVTEVNENEVIYDT